VFWERIGSRLSAEHSLAYAAALQAQRVPYELHVLEEGRHGFALRRPAEAPVAAWPDLFLRWAARHRFLPGAWTIGGGAPSPAPVQVAVPTGAHQVSPGIAEGGTAP
jgi:hypothetical protein